MIHIKNYSWKEIKLWPVERISPTRTPKPTAASQAPILSIITENKEWPDKHKKQKPIRIRHSRVNSKLKILFFFIKKLIKKTTEHNNTSDIINK